MFSFHDRSRDAAHEDGRQYHPLRPPSAWHTATPQAVQPTARATRRHRDVHEALYSTHTHSFAKKADGAHIAGPHRVSPTKRNTTPTRAAHGRRRAGSATAGGPVWGTGRRIAPPQKGAGVDASLRVPFMPGQVRVGFRIIRADVHFRHDSLERCLVHEAPHPGGTVTTKYPSDLVFDASATNENVGDALVPPILADAMRGIPSTVVAAGASRSGKTSTLFSPDGLLRSYVTQLLVELDRHRLAELWSIRCAVVDAVGDDLVDVLAPEEDQGGSVMESAERTLRPSDQRQQQQQQQQLGTPRKFPRRQGGGNDSSATIFAGGGGNDDGVGSHGKVMPNETLLRHSHLIQSQDDLDGITRRLLRKSQVSRHELVAVLVVPSQGAEEMRELIRPFGTVTFVELCAEIAATEGNPRALATIRHGSNTLVGVLAALTRKRRLTQAAAGGGARPDPSTASADHPPLTPSVYVPFNDDALSALLAPELSMGVVHVLLHIDGAAETSIVALTTLEVADRISSELHPDGPPEPDFRQVARELQDELEQSKVAHQREHAAWKAERCRLREELTMLHKAYDSAASRSESLMPASRPGSALSAEVDAMREELRAARQQLVDAQSEAQDLRSQLAKAKALQQQQQQQQQHYLVSPERDDEDANNCSDGKSAMSSSSSRVSALAALLQLLAAPKLIEMPRYSSVDPAPHSSAETVAAAASAAIAQLLHQLCERERAYEAATQRSVMFAALDLEDLDSDSGNNRISDGGCGSRGDEKHDDHRVAVLRDRAQLLKKELCAAPLLGWQQWRRVLDAVAAAVPEGNVVDCGALPAARTRAVENLFVLAADAVRFGRYWSQQQPFVSPRRAPPPSPTQASGAPGPSRPATDPLDSPSTSRSARGGDRGATLEWGAGGDGNDGHPHHVTTPTTIPTPPTKLESLLRGY